MQFDWSIAVQDQTILSLLADVVILMPSDEKFFVAWRKNNVCEQARLSCMRNSVKYLRGILKISLFHCSYFIKQLPFPSRIAGSMHLGCCLTFGKCKNTLACGSSIFTLSESLATSLVHGSRHPAWKTIRYSFIHIENCIQIK